MEEGNERQERRTNTKYIQVQILYNAINVTIL